MDLHPGIELKLTKTVTPNDSAKNYGSGMVDVLATPAMIGFMEQTCLELVLPLLEQGYNTVGTEVNIKHMKATPIGQQIECIARLTKVDGRILKFEVEVTDSTGKAGEGTHTRAIVNIEKFMSKIE